MSVKLAEYKENMTDPTDTMIDAGLAVTAAYLNIKGSALTINREKMRRRFIAMGRVALTSKRNAKT
jgi:hypothetical protein